MEATVVDNFEHFSDTSTVEFMVLARMVAQWWLLVDGRFTDGTPSIYNLRTPNSYKRWCCWLLFAMVSLRRPPKMPRGVVFSLVCCLILNKDQVNGFTVTHGALKTRQTLSRAQPTALFSQEPRRQPRRNLKKVSRAYQIGDFEIMYARLRYSVTLITQRRTRRERKGSDGEDFPWETAESRPLVLSSAIEAGEDYWIDEKDLEEAKKREEAMKNRKVRNHSTRASQFCPFSVNINW
jgi:hypothetical protein